VAEGGGIWSMQGTERGRGRGARRGRKQEAQEDQGSQDQGTDGVGWEVWRPGQR